MTDALLYTGICSFMYLPSSGLLPPFKNNNNKNKRMMEDCLFLAVALVMTDLLIFEKLNVALNPT